jgi:hypothetical protein
MLVDLENTSSKTLRMVFAQLDAPPPVTLWSTTPISSHGITNTGPAARYLFDRAAACHLPRPDQRLLAAIDGDRLQSL